jgi:hypothetical protein
LGRRFCSRPELYGEDAARVYPLRDGEGDCARVRSHLEAHNWSKEDWSEEAADADQVAVLNSQFVLAIKRNGELWRRSDSVWEPWDVGFEVVATGNGAAVWAVRSDGQLARFTGDPSTAHGTWSAQPGAPRSLISLAVGAGPDQQEEAWGCTADGSIYRYRAGQPAPAWQPVSGKLRTLTRGYDGTVMGTNADSGIYRYKEASGSWERLRVAWSRSRPRRASSSGREQGRQPLRHDRVAGSPGPRAAIRPLDDRGSPGALLRQERGPRSPVGRPEGERAAARGSRAAVTPGSAPGCGAA